MRTIRIGAKYDLTKFLFGLQSSLGSDRVGEFLPWRHRFRANLTGRIYSVLGFYRVDDLGDGNVEFGKLVRLHPKPHGILTGAENSDAGDPLHPSHLVVDIDVGVVGQKDVVVGPLGGIEGKHDQRGGG